MHHRLKQIVSITCWQANASGRSTRARSVCSTSASWSSVTSSPAAWSCAPLAASASAPMPVAGQSAIGALISPPVAWCWPPYAGRCAGCACARAWSRQPLRLHLLRLTFRPVAFGNSLLRLLPAFGLLVVAVALRMCPTLLVRRHRLGLKRHVSATHVAAAVSRCRRAQPHPRLRSVAAPRCRRPIC